MMLHRSTSSRRKRTSRNIGNSSQSQSSNVGGRRASLASVTSVIPTSEASSDSLSNLVTMDRQRVPRRGSTVPNISLDVDNNDSPEEVYVYY